MGFLGSIFGGAENVGTGLQGLGSLVGGAGGIMGGLGAMSQADAYYQTQMAQVQLQQQWIDMARSEAYKADEWIKSYAGSFGQQNFEGYDWAQDFMAGVREGKFPEEMRASIEGRTKQMAEGLGKTYQAGGERLAEGLATRGISKESGLAADIASQYESTTTGQLNELMANKRAEYENEMKNYAQSLINASFNDPTFSQYTYNQETNQIEARIPDYYEDPVTGERSYIRDKSYYANQADFDKFKSTTGVGGGIYDQATGKGWLYDSQNDSWFYVANGEARSSAWESVGDRLGQHGYMYGAPSDYSDYLMGDIMTREDYLSKAGIKSDYWPTIPSTSSGVVNNTGLRTLPAPTNSLKVFGDTGTTYKNYFKA